MEEDGTIVAPFGGATICVAHVFSSPHDIKTAAANMAVLLAAPDMFYELRDLHEQHKCGCGHPHCKSCARDRQTHRVLMRAIGHNTALSRVAGGGDSETKSADSATSA